MKHAAGKNIQKHVDFHLKKGALHKELHIAAGKHIPESTLSKDLKKAKKSGNVTEERRIVFAENFGHKKK